ncbi:DUF2795 domain-containing protein [Streptomyces pactum]|uniref:DUF2795 domain-containing protein n=1 Tax=Streptomyces pactum TaxID=68249 RepID=A0ABS0NE80_9ACTN|nr:DUF2795 domain-containing protein [Streptomyces pactum]MBH5333502.1 DUF2795 domain-containing protein [Streptomyces pactum]
MAEKLNPIEVQKALKNVNYPCGKQDLEQRARDNGASDTIVKRIHDAKRDRFDGPDDVQREMFGK